MDADFYFDLITALWLGFTGACVGSFLNVVAYRMPRGITLVWKPSHCPHCGRGIRARDNVPVLGWLALRGRCRDCNGAISPRYAIVEATLGVAFLVLAYGELFTGGANLPGGPFTEFTGAMNIVWQPDWPMIAIYLYHCLLMSLLLVLVLLDLDRNSLPCGLVGFTLVVMAACSLTFPALYPDRHWFRGVPRLAGLVDALAGAAILGLIGFAVWGVVRILPVNRVAQPAAAHALRYSLTLAFAGLTAGGFLGRYAALALLLLWAVGMVATRIGNQFFIKSRISILPSLWVATLLLILFWQPLVDLLRLR